MKIVAIGNEDVWWSDGVGMAGDGKVHGNFFRKSNKLKLRKDFFISSFL